MQLSSRNEILKRIKAAPQKRPVFVDTTDEPTPIYKPILPDPIICFKNELEAVNGSCILCDNEQDAFEQIKKYLAERNVSGLFCRDINISAKLSAYGIYFTNKQDDFQEMKSGLTGCEFLIARTGSVMVSSASESGRQMNVFPPIHLVLARASQIVDYPEDALNAIQLKYGENLPSTITTITGPSRTADIEKTLVLGAHGPKEFAVFLIKV